MVSTRTKFVILLLGVLWCCLLFFVMSSDWISKKKRSFGVKEPNFAKIDLGKSSRLHVAFVNEGSKKHGKPQHDPPLTKSKIFTSLSRIKKDRRPIAVVVAGNEETLMGVIAAINSVYTNTNSSISFYVTLPIEVVPHFRNWMKGSKPLSKIKYVVRELPSNLPQSNYQFAKLSFLDIFPELSGTVIYLDADTIVQGDIKELHSLRFKEGHSIFAANECRSLSKHTSRDHPYYSSHINLNHPRIKNLHLAAQTCTFNTDFFVANITEWRRKNIPTEFKRWIKFSKSGHLNGAERETDDAESIMLLTFYQQVGYLDQMWHVGHLGSAVSSPISPSLIAKAKLLHWNGRFKPWSRRAPFMQEWQKYFVEDPAGKYAPVRKKKSI